MQTMRGILKTMSTKETTAYELLVATEIAIEAEGRKISDINFGAGVLHARDIMQEEYRKLEEARRYKEDGSQGKF